MDMLTPIDKRDWEVNYTDSEGHKIRAIRHRNSPIEDVLEVDGVPQSARNIRDFADYEVIDNENRICQICEKTADSCTCTCSHCNERAFDDVTIADHGMCYDCHKKWQAGEQ